MFLVMVTSQVILSLNNQQTNFSNPLIYIGWGHATRANQVIMDILKLPAHHVVYVISTATDFIFQGVIKLGAIYRHADIDAGVVQPLPYTVDRDRTIKNLRSFLDRRPQTIQSEVEWLKAVNADCVICDAPFLPW